MTRSISVYFLTIFWYYVYFQAAYRDNTLGLPKYGQIESSHKIDRGILYTYLNSVHLPFRTVIAGAGVDHSQLVELTKKFMIEEKQPIWQENSELIDKSKKLDGSISQYTGGIVKVGLFFYAL